MANGALVCIVDNGNGSTSCKVIISQEEFQQLAQRKEKGLNQNVTFIEGEPLLSLLPYLN